MPGGLPPLQLYLKPLPGFGVVVLLVRYAPIPFSSDLRERFVQSRVSRFTPRFAFIIYVNKEQEF